MKVGNPKQAIALSIAAAGAIAFFVVRLIPAGPGIARGAPGVTSAEPVRSSTISGLPAEVLRDAFSHPALTKRFLATLPAGERPKSEPKPEPLPSPIITDSFTLLSDSKPLSAQHLQPAAESEGKPSENAGLARQQDKKPNSKIELKAIMRATAPLALVTIDGHQDVSVGLGEYIDATYRITQFSQNAVQLTSEHDKTWLYVGHEVTEK